MLPIPLAKLVRPHGFPKNGIVTLKADLFAIGGEIFAQSLTTVFVSEKLSSPQYKEIALVKAPAPVGGKWGQAKGVLLSFAEGSEPKISSIVALPREKFPPLTPGEFYIHDVLGYLVIDSAGSRQGKVVGFDDVLGARSAVVNIKATSEANRPYEFPSSWIERVEAEQRQLIVPDVAEWMHLADNAINDENEE